MAVFDLPKYFLVLHEAKRNCETLLTFAFVSSEASRAILNTMLNFLGGVGIRQGEFPAAWTEIWRTAGHPQGMLFLLSPLLGIQNIADSKSSVSVLPGTRVPPQGSQGGRDTHPLFSFGAQPEFSTSV